MKTKIPLLKRYFEQEKAVELAFLFGSLATGKQMKESDVDIAVYLKNQNQESSIWRAVQRILQREVDLVPLNSAPATLVSNVFKRGIPLSIKNRNLYWKLYLHASLEAEDFGDFAHDYWKISQRAQSLSPEDRTRLLERLDFLRAEQQELPQIQKITLENYQEDKIQKRNIERWTENVLNALIDIAKIVLASEKKEMPKTYEAALEQFSLVAGLTKVQAETFSKFARLRNLLAHEYLNILYEKIQEFIQEFPASYTKISTFLNKYVEIQSKGK